MSDKGAGFGVGWSKQIEAAMLPYSMGVVYQHEAREALRKAGYPLDEQVEMPEFDMPVPQPEDDFDYGEGDLHVELDDTDGEEPE